MEFTDEEWELSSWEKPNGFVVRGRNGLPTVIAYEEEGDVSGRGLQAGNDPVMFPDGVKEDELVLVHIVEGDNTTLIRKLESNTLTRDGESITVQELYDVGLLNVMATGLRDRYINRLIEIKNIDAGIEEAQDAAPCSAGQNGG